jgi:hypothetical protein
MSRRRLPAKGLAAQIARPKRYPENKNQRLHHHSRISFQNVSRDNTEFAILFRLHVAWFRVGVLWVTHMSASMSIGKATGNLEYSSRERFE